MISIGGRPPIPSAVYLINNDDNINANDNDKNNNEMILILIVVIMIDNKRLATLNTRCGAPP